MNFLILVLHWYFMLIVQGNRLQDKKKWKPIYFWVKCVQNSSPKEKHGLNLGELTACKSLIWRNWRATLCTVWVLSIAVFIQSMTLQISGCQFFSLKRVQESPRMSSGQTRPEHGCALAYYCEINLKVRFYLGIFGEISRGCSSTTQECRRADSSRATWDL